MHRSAIPQDQPPVRIQPHRNHDLAQCIHENRIPRATCRSASREVWHFCRFWTLLFDEPAGHDHAALATPSARSHFALDALKFLTAIHPSGGCDHIKWTIFELKGLDPVGIALHVFKVPFVSTRYICALPNRRNNPGGLALLNGFHNQPLDTGGYQYRANRAYFLVKSIHF